MPLGVPFTGRTPRWAAAAFFLIAAFLLNSGIQPVTGGRALFLPFFSALIAISLLYGVQPALLALLGAAMMVATFWIGHVWEFQSLTVLPWSKPKSRHSVSPHWSKPHPTSLRSATRTVA